MKRRANPLEHAQREKEAREDKKFYKERLAEDFRQHDVEANMHICPID